MSRVSHVSRPRLRRRSSLRVRKAEIVTILEDHVEDLELMDLGKDRYEVVLPFRGFEIKTVRLTVGQIKKNEGWVKV